MGATAANNTELYQGDFVRWTQETADKLRRSRFDEIDCEALAEEVESLGRSERNQLRTRLTLLLAQLLKWEYQPGKREEHGRSWQTTVKEQRRRVQRLLEENPSLKPALADCVADAYESAVLLASHETSLIEQDFPRRCPYNFDQILADGYMPG